MGERSSGSVVGGVFSGVLFSLLIGESKRGTLLSSSTNEETRGGVVSPVFLCIRSSENKEEQRNGVEESLNCKG